MYGMAEFRVYLEMEQVGGHDHNRPHIHIDDNISVRNISRIESHCRLRLPALDFMAIRRVPLVVRWILDGIANDNEEQWHGPATVVSLVRANDRSPSLCNYHPRRSGSDDNAESLPTVTA